MMAETRVVVRELKDLENQKAWPKKQLRKRQG